MIAFRVLAENCSHQGMIKDGKPYCGYKANGWEDWHPCKQKLCPLVNKPKEQELEGQMSIEDFIGGEND